MNIAISPLDAHDDAEIAEVLRLLAAARAHDVPDYPPPCRHSMTGKFRHSLSHTRNVYAVAWVDDRAVGYLDVSLPLRDNLDNSGVEVIVHPDYRRRGIGRKLYEYALEVLRQNSRKRVVGYACARLPGGVARDDAGCRFAEAMGATKVMLDRRSRLDLSTVDDSRLADLLAAAWRHATGYRLVHWSNEVPEEFIADAAYLEGRLMTDAPTGDMVWQAEQVDSTRIRENEASRKQRGVRDYHAGLVHEDSGRLVALTAIFVYKSTPNFAIQGITLVDPQHRGHRLGTVAKLENLAIMRRHEPEVQCIDTWNADTNTYMISINEAMGYRAVDGWVYWQYELPVTP